MFSKTPKERLSEIKEIKFSQQIKTIIASKYKNYCVAINLEFRNKKDQQIGFTKISEDPEDELEDPIVRKLKEGEQIIGIYGN
jgi:hypothetical protein